MEKINSAYQPSKEELTIISTIICSHKVWNASKYSPFKDKLKTHYRAQQSNLCCYCRKELGYDLKEVDIEHVLPKSKYLDFIFESLNLALSCPACNTSKGSQDVFSGSTHPIAYPLTSSSFTIIHPHYDNYSEHIEVVNHFLYAPLTLKGTETIRTCKLHRLNKVMKKANIEKEKLSAEALKSCLTEMSAKTRKELAMLLLSEI